jgi:ribonuclease HI
MSEEVQDSMDAIIGAINNLPGIYCPSEDKMFNVTIAADATRVGCLLSQTGDDGVEKPRARKERSLESENRQIGRVRKWQYELGDVLFEFKKTDHQCYQADLLGREPRMPVSGANVDDQFVWPPMDSDRAILACDGGDRSGKVNGYGLRIWNHDGTKMEDIGCDAGGYPETVNTREATGLLAGLHRVFRKGKRRVVAFTDSNLISKLVLGIYTPKNEGLRKIIVQIHELLVKFEACHVAYIAREWNLPVQLYL